MVRATRALRLALRSVTYPEGVGDAPERRAFEDEAADGNARMLRWLLCVLAPVHALAMIVPLGLPAPDPAHATWVLWMARLHMMEAIVGLCAAVVAWSGRPAALHRVLGDVVGAAYLLGTAAMSANAQRAHPNINAFVIGAVATAFFLRIRPRVYAPALLAGGAVVLAGIAHFPRNRAARIADTVSLFAAVSVALVGFFVARSRRFRELRARRQVELLNAELERRVEAQVGEIVGRVQEITELNTRLDQKVRERSLELSRALSRLAADNRALEAGTVLGGRVEIQAWIGQGGMGVVYRGRDLVTGKTVAVKVVQASSAKELDDLHRFLNEARAMASVTHPAIVRSIHVDVSQDGELFQVMELVEGETLDSRLARAGPLPPPVASRLLAVLAGALVAAHAAGVVHRDVKPSNVMLTRASPGLKLLDFGISKLWDALAPSSGNTAGRILGTPEFFAPEQGNDPAGVGTPADVYGLGLLLYLCLAGRMPFEADTSRNWLITHMVSPPVDLAKRLPDIDPTLARTVMACLEKDPGARPTAAAVAATLSAIADAAGTPALEALDLVRRTGAVSGSRGPTTKVSDSLETMDATDPGVGARKSGSSSG